MNSGHGISANVADGSLTSNREAPNLKGIPARSDGGLFDLYHGARMRDPSVMLPSAMGLLQNTPGVDHRPLGSLRKVQAPNGLVFGI